MATPAGTRVGTPASTAAGTRVGTPVSTAAGTRVDKPAGTRAGYAGCARTICSVVGPSVALCGRRSSRYPDGSSFSPECRALPSQISRCHRRPGSAIRALPASAGARRALTAGPPPVPAEAAGGAAGGCCRGDAGLPAVPVSPPRKHGSGGGSGGARQQAGGRGGGGGRAPGAGRQLLPRSLAAGREPPAG
uniref:anther-specific protein SF18 n=1 Tax=Lonchura striata TaxID=40157 RepID=UPI000B4DEE5A|nr:anther-specific protein SF18-like [Lonchura striata domestica]